MDEKVQQAVIAASAIKKLREIHEKFVANLASPATECPEIGKLTVSSGSIDGSCLEHSIAVLARPIVQNKQISAFEYNFITEWKDKELSVLRLYLQPGGVLARDPNGHNRFCDFNNTYIHRNILAALSESLLNSPVFAPAEGEP